MYRLFFVLAATALFACNSGNEENAQTDNASENATNVEQANQSASNQIAEGSNADPVYSSSLNIDWTGTYTAILPCEDCEGVETTITLNSDQSFTAKAIYKGKQVSPYEAQGTFKWLDDGTRIKMLGIDPSYMYYIYGVGENQITCLDQIGEPLTGKEASSYTLKKN